MQIEPISVLVVDDNEMNVDLLVNMLERFQYQVFTAFNGQEALDIAFEHKPEIVLLDISMPVMDGYEVCRRIKSNPETTDIPVIFISALDETDNVVEGFDVGAVDYITKPFKYREVIARLETQVTLMRQKRQIEAMRERERQQFERMSHLQRQFIGSATHDMKNPLFVISGYTDMIAMISKQQQNEQVLGFVESIKRGVHQMSELVYDILELLQLESQSKLDLTVVDVNEILAAVVEDMRVRATEKHITLTLYPADDAPVITADRRRLVRVLENLISNAIKYTPDDGRVDIECKTGHQIVQIEVIDNGLGIPEDELATIFEPFQRVNTEEHMAQDGTGLGLSIVQTLIEQHNGTIEVQSQVGAGSRFIVQLPIG